MAAAVVAWSPVIIRTRIPASWHLAMAALASARGGSTIPTIASRVRSCTRSIRFPLGSKEPGRSPAAATTMTRSPDAAMRSLASRARCLFSSVTGDLLPVGAQIGAAAGDQDVGSALHIATDDR